MIHLKTVDPELMRILRLLMSEPLFGNFRLVGGTALSLQIGHRKSIDIDLFSDTDYGAIDFELIKSYLKSNFDYCDFVTADNVAFGQSFFIGRDEESSVKLDLFYTEKFCFDSIIADNIRMASLQEIAAMKLDVVLRGARKKDFWDVHALLNTFSLEEMIAFHKKRYKELHDRESIKYNLIKFELAEEDFDPDCLRGNYWEFIKEDIWEAQKLLG